jgi:hypothetical protein
MPVGWAVVIVVLCVAVVTLGVVVIVLIRQVSPAVERAASILPGPDLNVGPAVGEPVPEFTAVDIAGSPVSPQELRGDPALLLFLSVGCGPCQVLATELRETGDLGGLTRQLVVVTKPEGPQALGIPATLRVVAETEAEEISKPLNIFGWPYAVALGPDGMVRAAQTPNTVKQLRDLAAIEA